MVVSINTEFHTERNYKLTQGTSRILFLVEQFSFLPVFHIEMSLPGCSRRPVERDTAKIPYYGPNRAVGIELG